MSSRSTIGGSGRSGDGGGKTTKGKMKRDYRKGLKETKYTMEEKKGILDMITAGARTCEIMRKYNCPESTVRNIKNKEALTASLKVYSRFGSRQLTDSTLCNRLLVMTEHNLCE